MAGTGGIFLRRFLPSIFRFLFLIHLAEYIPTASAEGHCIWYGVCSNTTIKQKNCLYEGPAKPIQQGKSMVILQKYCPDIAAGGVACCDEAQLLHLKQGVSVPLSLLERSPSCVDNFLKHICGMACSPNQSDFLFPKTTAPYNSTHTMITSVDYHLSSTYMNTTFSSCKDVQLPMNQSALDILCGEVYTCTPQRWFDFMGNVDVPVVPFQINYLSGDEPVDGFTPYNPPTRPYSVGLPALKMKKHEELETPPFTTSIPIDVNDHSNSEQ